MISILDQQGTSSQEFLVQNSKFVFYLFHMIKMFFFQLLINLSKYGVHMMVNLKKRFLVINLVSVMLHGPVIVDYWVRIFIKIFLSQLGLEPKCMKPPFLLLFIGMNVIFTSHKIGNLTQIWLENDPKFSQNIL